MSLISFTLKPEGPHRPFPGGADPGGEITCKQIMDGARTEGLYDPKCKCDDYEVLLVLEPGGKPNDYRWYRQDDDGTWSHKPGSKAPIVGVNKPEDDAKKRGYTQICGKLCVPKGGINVNNN